jgi:hypothetical protein
VIDSPTQLVVSHYTKLVYPSTNKMDTQTIQQVELQCSVGSGRDDKSRRRSAVFAPGLPSNFLLTVLMTLVDYMLALVSYIPLRPFINNCMALLCGAKKIGRTQIDSDVLGREPVSP